MGKTLLTSNGENISDSTKIFHLTGHSDQWWQTVTFTAPNFILQDRRKITWICWFTFQNLSKCGICQLYKHGQLCKPEDRRITVLLVWLSEETVLKPETKTQKFIGLSDQYSTAFYRTLTYPFLSVLSDGLMDFVKSDLYKELNILTKTKESNGDPKK